MSKTVDSCHFLRVYAQALNTRPPGRRTKKDAYDGR